MGRCRPTFAAGLAHSDKTGKHILRRIRANRLRTMPDINPVLHQFRQHYARNIRPPRYCGRWHITMVALIGGSVLVGALWITFDNWQLSNLAVIPVTVVIANGVEYLAHRGPMHRRVPWLGALHLRHSGRHHRYFNAQHMHFDTTADFHALLFPPVLLLFFGGIAVAIGALSALFLPPAAAALFVATAVAYYLTYETLHFLYHVPPHWRVAGWPGVRWLARLHMLHHDPRHMQQHNFNIVFPLCDWLAGTLNTGLPPTR
jgi:hypothetical protein